MLCAMGQSGTLDVPESVTILSWLWPEFVGLCWQPWKAETAQACQSECERVGGAGCEWGSDDQSCGVTSTCDLRNFDGRSWAAKCLVLPTSNTPSLTPTNPPTISPTTDPSLQPTSTPSDSPQPSNGGTNAPKLTPGPSATPTLSPSNVAPLDPVDPRAPPKSS